ncbi:hypothetical protein GMJAKD_05685 [Candidatus Electrothrix aarhusensis]|jgi:hypothetical protein
MSSCLSVVEVVLIKESILHSGLWGQKCLVTEKLSTEASTDHLYRDRLLCRLFLSGHR